MSADQEIPDVEYARSGDVAIAYQVVGEGPPDIVFARGFTGELLSMWEHPWLRRHVTGLAGAGRLLMLDKRGTGLSDRMREAATLEERMDDLGAVMDSAGSQRAVFWASLESARLAILFAATYPERSSGLVLLEPSIRGRQAPDYPWAPSDAEWRRQIADVGERWGRRDFFEELVQEWAPDGADDPEFVDWFVAHMRRGLSPGAAVSLFRAIRDSDVSDVLGAVRVPTMVLFKPNERGPAEYVADRVAQCELVELPRMRGIYTWIDDTTHEASIAAITRFVQRVGRAAEPDRVLATILFTDIVGSSERASQLGDRAWRDLLREHHAHVRRRLAEFRGEELDVAGDGFLASFDGPGRAIRCACAIRADLSQLDLRVRAGIHTGECERLDGKLSGIAVHTGARIAGAAQPGEVLVSSTVTDLVAGSGLEFQERGTHELKGVPGEWRLYAVVND
ncbi:MAG TPA: adenylate/guanylate cyclase domain-containing protein [Gaiellaceae bacterium]